MKHRLRINALVANDTLSVRADLRGLKQILYNLLSNSIKFTPPNGVITISAHDDDDFVCISVSDTGNGILADQIERLLKPYEQIDNNYTRSNGGTGLGLSVVDALVKQHGGRLAIESVVGKGSKFSVYLPLAPNEQETKAALAQS